MTLSETNAALDGLGILHDLRARNTRSRAHWTFHSDGRVLGYYGAAFLPRRMRKPSPWTNLRVPRNEVREVLASRLLPGTVRFGCRAVGYVEDFACGVVDVTVETVRRERETGAARSSVENCSDGAIRNEEKVGGGAGRPDWMDADGEGRRVGEREGVVETLRASLLVACDGVRSFVGSRSSSTDATFSDFGEDCSHNGFPSALDMLAPGYSVVNWTAVNRGEGAIVKSRRPWLPARVSRWTGGGHRHRHRRRRQWRRQWRRRGCTCGEAVGAKSRCVLSVRVQPRSVGDEPLLRGGGTHPGVCKELMRFEAPRGLHL